MEDKLASMTQKMLDLQVKYLDLQVQSAVEIKRLHQKVNDWTEKGKVVTYVIQYIKKTGA